ncbi:phototropin-2-like [Hordeum vulgare subsp. vulgare]|uniref:phototropin-2-like n=1 Tax=Hordeum vulgare subsp. vulgare TaxID=112509 RepID=UPI001D1A368D|nr:phototropin-2-like [Hordeum vulgare subsp. vulgare]
MDGADMWELQYFIGVQLVGSDHVEPLRNRLSENTEIQSAKLVKATAGNVDEAVRELPDANLRPEDLWAVHSLSVFPKPHKRNNSSWKAIEKIMETGEKIGLKHFKPVKPLGCGDTGSVHLVELQGSGELFAMKAMDKSVMLNRNKVHRAIIEREIYSLLDHPFLSTLYTSFQPDHQQSVSMQHHPSSDLPPATTSTAASLPYDLLTRCPPLESVAAPSSSYVNPQQQGDQRVPHSPFSI